MSLVAGSVLTQFVTLPAWAPAPAVIVCAGVLGVAIDIDHFPIARYNTGDWTALRRCLRSPRLVLFEQADIFPEDGVWPLQRLLSHVLIAGPVTVGIGSVSGPLGVVTGGVLYLHVLSDLIADVRQLDAYHHRHARWVAAKDGAPGLDEEFSDDDNP